ncbi:NAD(P)/FAD-dependent oxidoreductase [Tepidiforma sp.]|uniref:NAD(P)/FAD-dependent oxidoreductase n=1 Tax=Tepidiforma sp. TaxID=2682230 RepID=UPI002ADE89CB|nr:NAD(P)/FAD-dependent oxidoreductase [Tepidiforma sp.]
MSAPPPYDVAIIGGGAAGVAAALEAARLGATVALVEAERPGGSCVHFTCIPTSILLDAAEGFARARELAVGGILAAGESFQLGRANDRARTLARTLAKAVESSLRRARVEVVQGHAAFLEPQRLTLEGSGELAAHAVVIACGARWEPPTILGLPADRLVTPDIVQTWRQPPPSCLVLGGGPSEGTFALEYAVLLALAGSQVTLAQPRAAVFPAFDDDLQPLVVDLLAPLGITVLAGASPIAATDGAIALATATGQQQVDAAVVLAADPRVLDTRGLHLERLGLAPTPDGAIPVDETCATPVPGVYAAGDITGRGMLSSMAAAQGRAAGAGAAGQPTPVRLGAIPTLVHTVPPLAAVGLTAAAAERAGLPLASATLGFEGTAAAIARGGHPGLLRLHADRRTGEILGAQAAGPGAHELIASLGALMQAEVTADQIATLVGWHPSPLELLAEAARRLGT